MTYGFTDFQWDVMVRYGEVGPDGRAKISSVADWFQEAAGLSANRLGFGDIELFKRGLTWVLTRMIIRIYAMPHIGDAISVLTWPAHYDHFWHRGYQMSDTNGNLLAEASSAWTVIDRQTHRIAHLPDDIVSTYSANPRPVIPFSRRVLPKLGTVENCTDITVRRDDLDMNKHVNNAKYLAWLLEPMQTVPQRFMVDVQFRAETFPNQRLTCSCSGIVPLSQEDNAPKGRIYSIARTEEDGKAVDVCRAVIQAENEWE